MGGKISDEELVKAVFRSLFGVGLLIGMQINWNMMIYMQIPFWFAIVCIAFGSLFGWVNYENRG